MMSVTSASPSSLLLDEGGVVHAFVFLNLDIVGVGDIAALGLLALGLGVGVLEGDEFGAFLLLGRLGLFGLGGRCCGSGRCDARCRRGGSPAGVAGTRAGHRHDHLKDGAAFRADDRVLAEIVEFRAAGAA